MLFTKQNHILLKLNFEINKILKIIPNKGSKEFKREIALHVGAAFYVSASIVLALTSFLMMKQLDMINVKVAKPEVHLSTEGKASKKGKK